MNAETHLTESQRLVRQHHAAHCKRRYIKAGLFLLAAVLMGFIIGVGATVLHFRGSMHRLPPHPREIGNKMIEHLRRSVTITDAEEARIREIMEKHVARVEEMRKISMNSYGSMTDEVLEVIGPERFKIWSEYKKKEFGEKRRPPGPRRGDGPEKRPHTLRPPD